MEQLKLIVFLRKSSCYSNIYCALIPATSPTRSNDTPRMSDGLNSFDDPHITFITFNLVITNQIIFVQYDLVQIESIRYA